jgi:hypothetical protein
MRSQSAWEDSWWLNPGDDLAGACEALFTQVALHGCVTDAQFVCDGGNKEPGGMEGQNLAVKALLARRGAGQSSQVLAHGGTSASSEWSSRAVS